MAESPRTCLRVGEVEVSEQGGIIELPEAASVVGHRVKRARDKVVAGVVAMSSLEEGIEAKEVSAGRGGGGSALGGPSDSGPIVAVEPDGTFVNVAVVGENGLVRNRGRQFEVRDREGPRAALGRDQGGADSGGKRVRQTKGGVSASEVSNQTPPMPTRQASQAPMSEGASGTSHALTGRAEVVQEGIEAEEPMWGEFESLRNSVNDPPQHALPVRPMGVALLHLFDRRRGLPGAGSRS